MKNTLKLLIFIGLFCTLSACTTTGCNDYQSYRYAKAQNPVQVPADLEQPENESIAPKVQTENPDTIHIGADGQCLDKPPKI